MQLGLSLYNFDSFGNYLGFELFLVLIIPLGQPVLCEKFVGGLGKIECYAFVKTIELGFRLGPS